MIKRGYWTTAAVTFLLMESMGHPQQALAKTAPPDDATASTGERPFSWLQDKPLPGGIHVTQMPGSQPGNLDSDINHVAGVNTTGTPIAQNPADTADNQVSASNRMPQQPVSPP